MWGRNEPGAERAIGVRARFLAAKTRLGLADFDLVLDFLVLAG